MNFIWYVPTSNELLGPRPTNGKFDPFTNTCHHYLSTTTEAYRFFKVLVFDIDRFYLHHVYTGKNSHKFKTPLESQ